MSTGARRVSVSAFGVLAVVLLASAVAWACSPNADAYLCSDRTMGPAGSRTTICGSEFVGGSTVTIQGAAVVVDRYGEFAVPITVPIDAPVGPFKFVVGYFYYKVGALTKEVWFDVQAKAAGTGEAPAPVARTGGSTSGTEPQAIAEPVAGAAGPAANPNATSAETTVAPTGSVPAAGSAPASEAAPAIQATPAGEAARTLPVTANSGAVRTPSGRVVFGGSAAPERTAASAAGEPALTPDIGSPPAAPAGSTAGDLWSGFRSGTSAANQGLGLESSTPVGSSGSSAAVGGTLLLAGLMALFVGFGAAELGRRRAVAHAGDRTHLS